MEKFLLILFSNPQYFSGLSIRQVTLLIYLNYRLQPYFAKMLCTALAYMYMSAILIVVCVPEQKLPNDFCRDV